MSDLPVRWESRTRISKTCQKRPLSTELSCEVSFGTDVSGGWCLPLSIGAAVPVAMAAVKKTSYDITATVSATADGLLLAQQAEQLIRHANAEWHNQYTQAAM